MLYTTSWPNKFSGRQADDEGQQERPAGRSGSNAILAEIENKPHSVRPKQTFSQRASHKCENASPVGATPGDKKVSRLHLIATVPLRGSYIPISFTHVLDRCGNSLSLNIHNQSNKFSGNNLKYNSSKQLTRGKIRQAENRSRTHIVQIHRPKRGRSDDGGLPERHGRSSCCSGDGQGHQYHPGRADALDGRHGAVRLKVDRPLIGKGRII